MAGLTISLGRCGFCGAPASRSSPLVGDSKRPARVCKSCVSRLRSSRTLRFTTRPAPSSPVQRDVLARLEREMEGGPEKFGPRDARAKITDLGPEPSGPVSAREVLEEFRRGVEEHVGREDLKARFDLGTAYKEMGLWDEAIFELDLAVADPELAPQAHWVKAACHRAAGRLDLAIVSLSEAIRAAGSEKQKALFFYELSCVLVAQGEEGKARQAFKQAMSLDPNAGWEYPGEDRPHFKAAREAFAGGGSRNAYDSTEDEDVADCADDIETLAAILRVRPDDVSARLTFARLLADDEQIADAREQYRIAAQQCRREGDEANARACDIQVVALATSQIEAEPAERRCSFCDKPPDPVRPPARVDSTVLCADCLLEAQTIFVN